MRSLLVALDETPAGTSAAKYALYLATRYKAAVTGATVLDVDYLAPREPGGVGTAYYKFKADVARLKQGHELTERLLKNFVQQCEARNVRAKVSSLEGDPVAKLVEETMVHDLLVIGRDSDLHGEPSRGLADTVEKILRESPRPMIITPREAEGLSRVVIAYDGSVPAARTLQLFTMLGLAANSEIHVITVDCDQAEANRHVQQAREYLALYDVACVCRAIASEAVPAELVMAETRALQADLLVMGAYGRRGWRETLLGSFTTNLLSHCPVALFIHH